MTSETIDTKCALGFADHLWELAALPFPSCGSCGEACYSGALLCLHCVSGPITPDLSVARPPSSRRQGRACVKGKVKWLPKEVTNQCVSVVQSRDAPFLGPGAKKTPDINDDGIGAQASDASSIEPSVSSRMVSDTGAVSDADKAARVVSPAAESRFRPPTRESFGCATSSQPAETNSPRPISCVCFNCKTRYRCPWRGRRPDDPCDQLVWLSRFSLPELNLLSSCLLDRIDPTDAAALNGRPGGWTKAASINHSMYSLNKTLARFPRVSEIQEQMRASTNLLRVWSDHCAQQAGEMDTERRQPTIWQSLSLSHAASIIQSNLTWLYLGLASVEGAHRI